jgi:hypothetical protein
MEGYWYPARIPNPEFDGKMVSKPVHGFQYPPIPALFLKKWGFSQKSLIFEIGLKK